MNSNGIQPDLCGLGLDESDGFRLCVDMDETLRQKLYDPENFRRLGHELIDKLAGYLEQAQDEKMAVLPWVQPEERGKDWPSLPQRNDFLGLVDRFIEQSNHLHHPGFVGHQNSVPPPMLALCDLVGAVTNNSSAIFEMGPASVWIEKRVVQWMCERLGFGEAAGGVFTSGGTLGNLTALLTARQVKGGGDVWNDGVGKKKLGVFVSDQFHYSVQRAIQIMGLGSEGIIHVPTDSNFTIDCEKLPGVYEKALSQGIHPIALVATAGATPTGRYDRLDKLSDFCREKNLWLHVDGAHGASAAVSQKYRFLIEGIERADSVVWDAHKMLMVPSLSTGVLYREQNTMLETFSQQASYLFQKRSEQEWYNPSHRTLECTKRDLAFRVYVMLSVAPDFFESYVTGQFDLCRQWYEELANDNAFEVPVEPQSNILCFRFVPRETNLSAQQLNDLQRRIRFQVIESGQFYLTETQLGSVRYLRNTLMHPATTIKKLRQLKEQVKQLGGAILQG